MDFGEIASVGGFFALRTEVPPGGAVPLAQVYAGGAEPLGLRVAKVRAGLRAPETRIAVSVAQLGLAARLWSVALGAAALHDQVPDLDPVRLRWDPDASSPDDLWLDAVRALPVDRLKAVVLDAHLASLGAALRREYRVSERLLWGNAGSALAGAARELHRWARREGRPDVGARALALATELLSTPELQGTGTLRGTAFRRRSCCLYYRAPGGGLCGDCCFDQRPGRRADRGDP
ncbi:(2Fe-2S)-binding protein [Streptomyces apocyni]|uniref:(2Fe-2S)-binding protein n=1 Tax=Streptomyces apocyni TaxID=2654677 RepID=UPI0012E9DA9F|nr:(2Fe-2S)-binding protein [Streptomyces apocyni]